MKTTDSQSLSCDLDAMAVRLRVELAAFWHSQLRIQRDGRNLHIAYPSLLHDGWQVAFTLAVQEGASILYRLTDHGRTADGLEVCGATGDVVHRLLDERCRFFGVNRVNGELVKESLRPFTATEIGLYAECVQAVSNLAFRAEAHDRRESVARDALETIIRMERLQPRESNILPGLAKQEHRFDRVLGRTRVVACKIIENRRAEDFERNLELWGFRIGDAKRCTQDLRTAIIYNADISGCHDDLMRLGTGITDLFAEYTERDRIVTFLNRADAA